MLLALAIVVVALAPVSAFALTRSGPGSRTDSVRVLVLSSFVMGIVAVMALLRIDAEGPATPDVALAAGAALLAYAVLARVLYLRSGSPRGR